ncbi:ABC transporter ATP-binding protein [Nocardiopsis rhodophaea]
MPNPVIAMTDVVRRYGDRRVLGPLSLNLDPGECLAVTGPNGAGKSTLVRIAGGRELPDEGVVEVCSRTPNEFAREFRRDVSVLDEAAFYPDLTVREHLELIAVGHGCGADSRHVVTAALRRCRLVEHADLTPGRLSRGLQQLTLIATLLVRPHARLLILDEPERHLDAAARDSLTELLAEAKSAGSAILLATHHETLVDRLADMRLRIADGTARTDAPKGQR